jgi:hypothetical protein
MSWTITGTQRYQPAALLDQFPGAAAAYSLRNLVGTSNPAVVRVRRDNDDTEADFTAAEVSDGTLAAWVGAGNNGFVRTWYDQSGNSRDVEQATTSSQPSIVSSGVVITDDTGKPSILYSNSFLQYTASMSLTQPLTLVSVSSANVSAVPALSYITDNTSRLIFGTTTTADKYGYYPGSTFATAANNIDRNTSVLAFIRFSDSNSAMYIDSALAATGGSGSAGIDTNFTLGKRFDTQAGNHWPGYIPELIVYATDKSADRAAIEANINAHYNIF